MIKSPKKLIEVALPLDDINTACAKEKSIRHGQPSTLHLWWARRPLAAARAVLFAQLVNDPGGERGWGNYPGQTKEDAQAERERLFKIMRKFVIWANSNNKEILEEAKQEILKSWRETCRLNGGKDGFDPDKLPSFHDPFAGGGTIPLEAQRLGLDSFASDLNPIAVIINKAMIQIPPKFSNHKPICLHHLNKEKANELPGFEDSWKGLSGLTEDVRYYGQWVRNEAQKRIGYLFPDIVVNDRLAKGRDDLKPLIGHKLKVISWIWARTVRSPNPAYNHVNVPLIKSFVLSNKKGKEIWVRPVVNGDNCSFQVIKGKINFDFDGTVSRQGGKCLLSNSLIPFTHIRNEGKAGRLGLQPVAVVAAGKRGRLFLSPPDDMVDIANLAEPAWLPKTKTEGKAQVNIGLYGLTSWDKLYTKRQLAALNTLSELVEEVRINILEDAKIEGLTDDGIGIDQGGLGAEAYADAIATLLGADSQNN